MLERELPFWRHMMERDVPRITYDDSYRTTGCPRSWRVLVAVLCLLVGRTMGAQVKSESPLASAVRAVGNGASKAAATQRRQPAKRRTVRRTPVRTARSPAVVGPSFTSPRTASALAVDLGSILRAQTRGGTWGVVVASVTRGDTLFSINPDALLKPASIMKMMT